MADRGYRGRPQRGERADRQINAGHSRGLDAALSDTEAKIRKLKTERIYAYDQNGKEISHSTRGTSTSTKLPSGYNYKDAILTHNHPGKGLTNNIAGRIGRSFSSADIATAVINNASEVRAITGTYTYSMKRPKNGWGISTQRQAVNVARKIKDRRMKYFNSYVAKPSSDYTHGRISREQLSIVWDRADVVSTNKALREVAKEYGWDYTRKRTS